MANVLHLYWSSKTLFTMFTGNDSRYSCLENKVTQASKVNDWLQEKYSLVFPDSIVNGSLSINESFKSMLICSLFYMKLSSMADNFDVQPFCFQLDCLYIPYLHWFLRNSDFVPGLCGSHVDQQCLILSMLECW